MRKLMELGAMMILTLGLLTGCKSYTEKSSLEKLRLDGTVESRLTTHKSEQSPFHNKSMTSLLDVYGLNLSMVDPESGSVSPTIKLLDGSSVIGSMPVTSDTDNKLEIFGTYKESFSYSTSIFNFGANIGDIKFSREAGGIGVFAIDSTDKNTRLKTILEGLGALKTTIDASKADVAAPKAGTTVPGVPGTLDIPAPALPALQSPGK